MSDSDDSDQGPPSKKAKTGAVPLCPYGERCYRKNPQHFKDFAHPKKDGKTDDKTKNNVTVTKIDPKKLPPCPFGAGCYRKNLIHFAEYSHPTSGAGPSGVNVDSSDEEDDDAGSSSNTDVYNTSDDDNDGKVSSVGKQELKTNHMGK